MADFLDAAKDNEFQRLRSRHNQSRSFELGPVASSLKFRPRTVSSSSNLQSLSKLGK